MLLVILPFTAPFPTCEMGVLLGGSASSVSRGAPVSATSPAFDSERRDSSPGPLFDEESFKDVILTTVTPVVSPAVEDVAPISIAPAMPVFRAPLVALRL